VRIRSIKPEYFSHPEVTRCSIPARLLLISLFTQADDEGRLYDQPRKIAGLAFGESDVIDAEDLLRELAGQGRIQRYAADDKRVIQVVNFKRHQRIDRANKSVIPGPRSFAASSTNDRRALDEPSLLEGKGREGIGKEGNGSHIATTSRSRQKDPIFEAFCEVTNNDWHEFSGKRRGEINGMVAFVKSHGGTDAEEIRKRAGNWPFDVALTPEGFVKHWASLSKPRSAKSGPGSKALGLARRLREAGQ
jgi:hypothetical protein